MSALPIVRICTINGCDRVHFCKGYCRKHFERWKSHGDPHLVKKRLSKRGAPIEWIKEHLLHEGADCLIWPFARMPDGRAHMNGAWPTRVMCEIVNGPPPTEKHEAAHSCGNGHLACVHPKHLRWATAVENAADKDRHGTVIRGSMHHNSRLSESDVKLIRLRSSSTTQQRLADEFGVKLMCINKIINRVTWKHI